MQELLDILPSSTAIREFLNSRSTWWQAGVFLMGLFTANLLGSWLQERLQTVTPPSADEGVTRTAVRTGALALVPVLLWLWLLAAMAILRNHDAATNLLHPSMILVGALAVIRMVVFVLRHSLAPGGRLKAWEGVVTAGIWILVALHILDWLPFVQQMLDEYALNFGKVRISLYNVASFVLSIAILLLLALGVTNTLRNRIMRSDVLEGGMKIALSKLVRFVLLTLAVVVAMMAAGIDLTAFAVFGGALGVGLGLGLQRVVSNFISGFILVFEGSIRTGDVISYGNTLGTVKALHTRHVVIHTLDGLDILVPNENLMTTDITNWSYEGDRRVRLRLPVQISYDNEPEEAMTRLVRVSGECHLVLKEPAAMSRLTGFGDNGVNLELQVWVEDPERSGEIRSELYRLIWKDFKALGINFPYPQRDVYIKDFPASAISPPAGKPGNHAESARGQKRVTKAKRPE
jgi:small-conductance mechanosensitive channel